MVVNEIEIIKQSDIDKCEKEGLIPIVYSTIELLKLKYEFDIRIPLKENIEGHQSFDDIFKQSDLDYDVVFKCLTEPILIPIDKEDDYQNFGYKALIQRVIDVFEVVEFLRFNKSDSLYLDFLIKEINTFYQKIPSIHLKPERIFDNNSNKVFEILNEDLENRVYEWAFKDSKKLFNIIDDKDFFPQIFKSKEKFELLRTLGVIDLIEEKWHFIQNGNKIKPNEYATGVGILIAHILFVEEKEIKKQAENLRKYYSNFISERNQMGSEHRNTPHKLIQDNKNISSLFQKINLRPN
jgi:hypothetical protein